MAGSYDVLGIGVPKRRSLICPQTSPPPARRSCASGLSRLQSAARLPLLSVQERVTRLTRRVLIGLPAVGSGASPYLPMFTLTAVLPLPKMSYAPPRRGERSLNVNQGVSGKSILRVGTSGPGPKWIASQPV